ncbi:hypothetical protein M011DRAFT_478449 [Sporormia fimetaria CBS 119925]|uniref:Uncharacterized protein n=1 Tax=Sporormia fimetaria CBS 119925 TaxID=1340428 RepID=A0A6A6V951_9PLEO|nr:hypothetical protein M011DRAFT_478449 [Sporormia fimetaria CBS 119925]
MSSSTTNNNNQATEDDPSVPFKVGGKQDDTGISTGTIDNTNPGIQNAGGTSEQRRGQDVSFTQDPGEKGYVGTKTASESLVEGIERSA